MTHVRTFGNPPKARTYHTANIIDSYMIVIAGETEFDMNDIYLLDLRNYIWIQLGCNEKLFHPRRFHTSTI